MSCAAVSDRSVRKDVTCGDLSLVVDGADLRYVRWGGVEIVRRIYVTVRDEDWDTPALDLEAVKVNANSWECSLRVEATSRSSNVEVDWRARAYARADGSVAYEARFTPRRAFRYARMGLCVLFPPSALVGRDYEAWTGGMRYEGRFESQITPQLIRGEEILALFPAFERLRIEIEDVGSVELSISGDLLEMEDQRNWSDGSFKAYCTPLSLPRPREADPHRWVDQRVAITVSSRPCGRRRRPRRDAIGIAVGEPTGASVPAVGTLLRELDLGGNALTALGAARFEHLRIELRRPDEFAAHLSAAESVARRVDTALSPALFLSGDLAEMNHAADRLAALADPPSRVFVFPREVACETRPPAEALRVALAGRLADVPIIGGTDVWFVDLNRSRPDQGSLEGVAWSITPQVHSQDSLTLFEGLEAQADQVRTAQSFVPGLQLVIGPITLRPRYNANARDAREQALDPPSSSIDPRQSELVTAAWTVGSLSALAETGVTAATYFEAVGSRGIMSASGHIYPVWHALATAAGWVGQPSFATVSEDPLKARALVVAAPGGDQPDSVLVANLSDEPQRVYLGPLPMRPASARVLDCATAKRPPSGPFGHIQERELPLHAGHAEIDLGPYALANLRLSL